MRKVFKVTGLHARCAGGIGDKTGSAPVINTRGRIASNDKPAVTVGKCRIKKVDGWLDYFAERHGAFKGAHPETRQPLHHSLSRAVPVR